MQKKNTKNYHKENRDEVLYYSEGTPRKVSSLVSIRLRSSKIQSQSSKTRIGFTGSAGIMSGMRIGTIVQKIKNHQESAHAGKFDISCKGCIELNEQRKESELEERHEIAKSKMCRLEQTPVEEALITPDSSPLRKVRSGKESTSESQRPIVQKQTDQSSEPETNGSQSASTSSGPRLEKINGKRMSWLRIQNADDLRELEKPVTIYKENEPVAVLVPYKLFEGMAKRIAGGKPS